MGAELPETEPSSTAASPLSVPGEIGKFRLIRKLGAGGMGVVHEAEDLELGVRVALKTLHTTNPQTLYRFKQEFRALAEIVHPRLVRLFELVSEEGIWFFPSGWSSRPRVQRARHSRPPRPSRPSYRLFPGRSAAR